MNTKFKIKLVKSHRYEADCNGNPKGKPASDEVNYVEVDAEYATLAYVKARTAEWSPVSHEIIGEDNQHHTKIPPEAQKILDRLEAEKKAKAAERKAKQEDADSLDDDMSSTI